MKRPVAVILAILLLWLGADAAQAQEDETLRPLSEILREETSPVMVLYSAQRCAALFAVVVERTRRNPSATEELIRVWEEASGYLIQISTLLLVDQRDLDIEKAGETALETIFKISKLYDSEMEEYYLRTGSSFNEKIEGDITTCTEVHSSLKEGFGN